MNNIQIFETKPIDFQSVVEAAACYIEVNGKVLWLKRAGPLENGFWGVPAGKIEKGETPLEGALRELKEETGIILEKDKLSYLGPLYIRKPDIDYVYHSFKITLGSLPRVDLSREHSEYKWASGDELKTMPLMAGAAKILELHKKPKRGGGTALCVYLILRKGDQILLHLRKNTGYADGMYGMVSGHVEDGESAMNAMIREAGEEAGIIPLEIKPIHFLHSKTNRLNMNIFFECTKWKGEIINKEPEKCEELKFFPLNKLPLNMQLYLKEVLREVAQGNHYSELGFV